MTKLSTLTAFAIAAIFVATAGAASAAPILVKAQPKLSTQVTLPKISLPKICKNEITRTVKVNGISYTAKKCR